MKKNILAISVVIIGLIATGIFLKQSKENGVRKPLNFEEEEYDKEKEWKKVELWTAEKAARHQKVLDRLKGRVKQNQNRRPGDLEQFGGAQGRWYNKAPNNMPGAFKFADLLDGTDTLYAVTHNHYVTEFNSKSYIWKGTVYNPKSGAMGDDFERLTGHWPNRYNDMFVFKNNGKTRIVVGVENGPVYFSDNDGEDWTKSSGIPSAVKSTIINRTDNVIYTSDGEGVYKSEDGGVSFSLIENVGNGGDVCLYSPRHNNQPSSEKVYLALEGDFYELNVTKTSFTRKGAYSGAHNNRYFSIGGDTRKLYVTVNEKYYTSTNDGSTWTTKNPMGNYYGDRTEIMNAGKYIAVNPEDEDNVVAGYVHPVFSTDGLTSTKSTTNGWGRYQNGTNLNLTAYEDRIRYNYHPDFQSHHFFYNSSGDLFTVGCTDGGIFVSYKDWFNHPNDLGDYINYGGRQNSHYINITVTGVPTTLIYRHAMFTGYKDPNHINYGTQDQGSQDFILGTTGDTLSVYQSIGGDGPSLGSADGNWVWKWDRAGGRVWAPVQMYDGNTRRSIGNMNNLMGNNQSATLSSSSSMGWCAVYIDRYAPDKRMWVLGSRLTRAEVDNAGNVTGSQKEIGSFGVQITAFAQSNQNPDAVYFMKQGLVYKSTDRGDSWGNGTSTPFASTGNPHSVGAGWVLPGNDNWILFAGPAGNNVGAILSKDGGVTWSDVTGDLPSGNDFQVSGLVGSPDGKFVYAGTDLGPYVFNVVTEEWTPMFGGEAAMFNAMGVEYIASTNTVRFGTWGSGVWDFVIDDGAPNLDLTSVEDAQSCDSLRVSWSTNMTGSAVIKLLKGGVEEESWNINDVTDQKFSWSVPSDQEQGSDYSVSITSNGATRTSSNFNIGPNSGKLASSRLSIDFVDSEHNNDRLASFTIDDDPSTFWHTEWSPGNPGFPHTIIYASDTTVEWTAFSYLPRQDGGANGRINEYEVYGSNDKTNWTLLKAGSLTNNETLQKVNLDQTMACKYVKFEMLSEQSGAFFASMAEFGLYHPSGCGGLVSTNENLKNNDIQVYPTYLTAGNIVKVKGYNGLIEVFTISGQKIRVVNLAISEGVINTAGMKPGTYLIRSVGSAKVQSKIVVN